MIRIFLPLICAALGLAAASCSQSEGPFAPAEAPASPHGTAAAAMASPSEKTAADDAEHRDATAGAVPTDGTGQAPQAQATGSTPPGAPQPAAAKSPDVPDQGPPPTESATSAAQLTPEANPDAPVSVPAQRRASTLVGMPVVAGDGSPLGQVKDIIFDRQGQATHVVVGYGAEPPIGPAETADANPPESADDGKLTAMPWDAAMASIRDGRLVLDGAKLQQAPSFKSQEWPNLDDRDWSAVTDDYWRKVVRASVAAHPGAPIDSTARQRGRRARGDNE